MKQILLSLIISLSISNLAFGQKEEKIYYDSEWKVCQKSKAEYYRLITIGDNLKPIGKVRDYYLSGELQWEGQYSYVDKYDNSKDIQEGLCIWYHKNGQKSRESTMLQGKEHGTTTYWYENGQIAATGQAKNGEPYGKAYHYYENGNKKMIANYLDGKLDGEYLTFYESGKLYRKFIFKNGKPIDKWFTECDELGKCQSVFFENFFSSENINNWAIIESDKSYSSKILPEKGLIMQTKTNNGFRQTIHLPIEPESNFSIETIVEFKSGEKNSGQGLIWGFKDWENYFYFYISANGYYKIGAKTEGIDLELTKWKQSSVINQNYSRNQLKILRIDDNLYFSINGQLIESLDFYVFRGNHIGFSILSGEKEVLFENLIVKKDLEGSVSVDNISSNDWKGNGTGFFIDNRGYIATNYHVVEDAREIEVEFILKGEKKSFKAEVIQNDKQNDLSIIKIEDNAFSGLQTIPYNFTTGITDVGSNIFSLGYPMALSVMGTEVKFTDGKISSKTGYQGDITTYQISVPIQSGNSGGPLFDFDGNLIGITSSGLRKDLADNVNYAIKSSYLKTLIDVLPQTLNLPKHTSISNYTLTEKIKILSDYVVLIKIK